MLNEVSFNYSMNLFGIIVCVICAASTVSLQIERSLKIMLVRIYSLISLTVLSYLVSITVDSLPGRGMLVMNHIANFLNFGLNILIFYLYVRFVEYRLHYDEAGKQRPSRILEVAQIPVYISLGLNPYTHWLYYINQNNTYIRGPYYGMFSLYFVAVILMCFVMVRHRWEKMDRTARVSFVFDGSVVIFAVLMQWFDQDIAMINLAMVILVLHYYVEQLKVEMELRTQREEELRLQQVALEKMKTKLMLSQIQPHFLYNTLNTIYYLCDMEPVKAQETVERFAEYLRMNMKALEQEGVIPFEEELKHTQIYLWIEKLRFEERLNVELDIQDTDFTVPALSLQPLVENAVRHGICTKPQGGTIRISSRLTDNYHEVVVEDDGTGFNPETELNEDGNGISNVRGRLMAEGASLRVESREGKGTVVTVHIPA